MTTYSTKPTELAFEDSIVELCKTLSSERIIILDNILSQKKDEITILKDIVHEFPNFQIIYSAKFIE